MKQPQTTFAKRNPWTGVPTNMPSFVEVDKLKITNAPVEIGKLVQHSKYDALFSKLKHGQAIETEAGKNAPKIANTLRKWLEKNNKKGIVRHNRMCADGKGRVWLLEENNEP